MSKKYMFKKGDTIKCRDEVDLLNTHRFFEDEGYETEFCYEKDGVKGFWLEIVGIEVF